ncbi:hypothetical protein AB0H43_13535 [Hamadaea sp. NPDC050747]|uniref:hypothetical protein n=1 Tax=Hamadaea sp. NPDC050747 TaxID=3155789 RepID=UPI0033DF24CF
MGRQPTRHDLASARRRYAEAVRRVQQAILGFHAAGIALNPEVRQIAHLWTREQVAAVVEIRDAWIELADARRAYERILRADSS